MASQQTWTIQRTLDWTRGYLERKGDEHPRLSTEWMLSYVTGLSRVELYTNFDRPLTPDELHQMHAAIERRAAGEPLQYVTGEMPFRHIVLTCEPGVLIPRPESETLVDAALEGVDAATLRFPPIMSEPEAPVAASGEAASEGEGDDGEADQADPALHSEATAPEPKVLVPEGCRVLEIGTGTGCIALSIASERPGTRVAATDLSPAAIALATRNRDALGLEHAVDIVECDLAEGVDPELMGTFSVLVSNPPYIPTAVLAEQVPPEVKDFEPHLALDGGADGLDVFRRILELAPRALAPEGMLCCELYEGHLSQAADLVREQGGWGSVEVREDLTHRPRVLVAKREA